MVFRLSIESWESRKQIFITKFVRSTGENGIRYILEGLQPVLYLLDFLGNGTTACVSCMV